MATVMKEYYQIEVESIKQFYMTLGIDIKTWPFDSIDTKVSDLYYISPYYFDFEGFPNYNNAKTRKICDEYLNFLEKVCSFRGSSSSIYDVIKQQLYMQAYFGILSTAANINLIPESSNNYLLYFARLDTIIITAMTKMNNMSEEDLLVLYSMIKKKDAISIIKLGNILAYLIYLGMHPNDELEDYCIFDDEKKDEISLKNLANFIENNVYRETEYEVTSSFIRPSYETCKELTPISKK